MQSIGQKPSIREKEASTSSSPAWNQGANLSLSYADSIEPFSVAPTLTSLEFFWMRRVT